MTITLYILTTYLLTYLIPDIEAVIFQNVKAEDHRVRKWVDWLGFSCQGACLVLFVLQHFLISAENR